jgi:hypothetical protein
MLSTESNGQKKFQVHLVCERTLIEERWADENDVAAQLKEAECLCNSNGVPVTLRCPVCHGLVSLVGVEAVVDSYGRKVSDSVLPHGSCIIRIVDGFIFVGRDEQTYNSRIV